MNKLKNNKGITLVALIITIIVLLILAMVSINLVMNGGIIDKSKSAVDKYSEEEVQEQIKLAYSEWQMGQYMGETKTAAAFMDDKLEEVLGLGENDVTVTGSNGVFVVKLPNNIQYIYDTSTGGMLDEVPISAYPTVVATTNNSAVTENSKYVSNNKTAVIPAGYTISNVEAEQSIDTGLVIKKDGNEWVWIPVSTSDLALMYTEDPTGWTMYGTSGENAVVTKYKSNARTDIYSSLTRVNPGDSSSHREPDTLGTLPSYLGSGETDKLEANWTAAGFSSFNNMATKLKDDYKNMIDSVKKYGGFYVGRYELSNAGTQKNQASLTNTTWYNMYAKCKTLGSTSAESRMIWGCQWDQICKFISTAKDANGDTISLTDSSKYGNYSNSQAPANTGNYVQYQKQNTGSNEAWKTNNIYDLAGNCWECTQEAYNTSGRAVRGGKCSSDGSSTPVTRRGSNEPTGIDNSESSRPTLYIK